MTARVLSLKSTSPDVYGRILDLEDNLSERGECPVMARNREAVLTNRSHELANKTFLLCSRFERLESLKK